jgi:hypothetical protein
LPIIDTDPARFDEPLQAIPLNNITTDDDFDFYMVSNLVVHHYQAPAPKQE